MRTPRRYRLALLAYPPAYRADRGPELEATLAEGDEQRGRPSLREAAALVWRGIAMRAGTLQRPDWLLVAAAALSLLALLGGFTWAERRFLFRGEVAAWATDGPGLWWALALGVVAYVALAATLFGVLDNRRRRRVVAALAAPLALGFFTLPESVFAAAFRGPQAILDHITWRATAIFMNWEITVPMALAAVAATWVALGVLGGLAYDTRRRVLSICLALPASVAIAQTWLRPDLDVDAPRSVTEGYAQSAFSDLGFAAFLTSAGLVLALAALLPARPKPRL